MKKQIKKLNYKIEQKIISPMDFKIPQTRDRLYIVARQNSLINFEWPKKVKSLPDLKKFLVNNPKNEKKLTENKQKVFYFWKKFFKKIPKKTYLPNPLWTMEFGATYPYENKTPYSTTINLLKKYKGSFGKDLRDMNNNEVFASIPNYARTKIKKFPDWKIRMIKRSRDFYKENKKWLDQSITDIEYLMDLSQKNNVENFSEDKFISYLYFPN